MILQSFKEKIFYKNRAKIKLIQFWSTWCGTCINIDHLKSFHKENPDIEIYRVNVEENQILASKYSVVIVPTYIVFKNLKPVSVMIGEQSKESLAAIISNLEKNPKTKLAKKK